MLSWPFSVRIILLNKIDSYCQGFNLNEQPDATSANDPLKEDLIG